jgi:predicted RNA-binding Zn-ribbon protein involved in translation (DUF1610 family)
MSEGRIRDWHSRRVPPAATLWCSECGQASVGRAQGWRALRLEEPGADEPSELSFVCPPCGQLVPRVG